MVLTVHDVYVLVHIKSRANSRGNPDKNPEVSDPWVSVETTSRPTERQGAEPGRALFLYTPGGAGRMFEEARRLQRPLSSMGDREIAEFFKRFGWETVGPPASKRKSPRSGGAIVARLVVRGVACTNERECGASDCGSNPNRR